MNSLSFQLVDLRWTQRRRAKAVTQTIHDGGCERDMQTKTDARPNREFGKVTIYQ
jgi:hypothetical protein